MKEETLIPEISARLIQYRKLAGFSRDAVTERGVSFARSTLQAWEGGEREPSISGVHELAKIYDVPTSVLMFGEDGQNNAPCALSVGESEYDYVPFYKAEASAGHGSFLAEHREPTHHLAFRKRWLKATGHSIKDLVGLLAHGDSMEPAIKDRAAIIISLACKEPADGHVYVIRVGEMLWVKRTRRVIDGGLCLKSDNRDYDDIILSPQMLKSDDVEIIGQVVHTAYDLI